MCQNIAGQNFGDAFANSFKGIEKSMAMGMAIGVATTIGVSYANGINPWTGKTIAAKTELKYSDDLVKSAQKLYPNKAGKIELHHITPKYLGGAKNGQLVPLDGAYHQVITNEFRAIQPYGLGHVNDAWRLDIMNQVYTKYPLPPDYTY